MTARARRAAQHHHRHHHHDAAEEGHPPLLDGRARCRSACSGKRVVGPAFTLRFVPVREDLATPASWSKPISTRARDRGHAGRLRRGRRRHGRDRAPGIFGDILCMRMVKRGVTALITDGVMRDKHGVLGDRLAGLVRGRRRAGLGQSAHLRRLERADRLRRLRDFSRRHHRGRRRRRGGDPAGRWSTSSPTKAPSTSGWRPGWCRKSRRAPSSPASIRPTKKTRSATRSGRKSSSAAAKSKFHTTCHGAVKELSPA